MKIGTKSLLFGVHQVFLHPLIIALAWWKLYGFPWNPCLWLCFIIHDWGYWGLPEMDGSIGDYHPILGAKIAHVILDEPLTIFGIRHITKYGKDDHKWQDFCCNHSRFLAAQNVMMPSKLCMADKLAVVLEPWWLYLPRAWASGELKEYMNSAKPGGKYDFVNLKTTTSREWYQSFQASMQLYVKNHSNGQKDLVTKIKRCNDD